MHNLYATFIFSFFFLLPFTLNAQQWVFSSEISPTSRMGNKQVLSNADTHFNLDWRNRLGMDIGNQFFLGLQANVRRYKNGENLIYSPTDAQNFTYGYDLTLSNVLWGVGPFLTKKIKINPKMTFLTTVFASMEQGSGSYEVIWTSFNCPVCASNFSIVELPSEIGEVKFRERNLLSGLEIGASYKITSKISLLGNINLIQFEDYTRKPSAEADPIELEPHLNRNIFNDGSGFTHFLDRPMIYVGALINLGN